ncbi:hypothetical protein, partial [Treponema sp.]|uniref:hypothetical protein n=1 Tax=Treponema sp. TaxID=166 RepID=UPI00388D90C5
GYDPTSWQELHYKKLYQAFQNVISAEACSSLGTLKMSAKELKEAGLKKATAASLKKLTEKPLEYFYEVANKFAESEYIEEEKARIAKEITSLRQQIEEEKARLAAKEELKANAIPSSKAKKGAKSAKTLTSLEIKKLENQIASLERVTPKFTKIALPKTLAFPKGGAKAKISDADVYLYIFSMLFPLAKTAFARKWSLERKIAELTGNTKIGSMESFEFFKRAFALSEGKQPLLTEKSSKEDLLLTAQRLCDSELAWLYIGANEYDGVKWFNKEKMEDTLCLYQRILSLGSSASKQKTVDSLFKKLNSAQKKAEYKCEAFTAQFTVKPKTTRQP